MPVVSADLDKAIAPWCVLQEVRSSQISAFFWVAFFLQRNLVYIYSTISICPDGPFNSVRGHQDICVSTFLFHFKRTGMWFCVLVLERYFSAIKDGKTSLLLSTFVKKWLPLNIQQGCMSHREKHYYVKGKKEIVSKAYVLHRNMRHFIE